MIFLAKNDLGSSEEDRKRESRTTMERKVGVKEERFFTSRKLKIFHGNFIIVSLRARLFHGTFNCLMHVDCRLCAIRK